jgi:hypothetical protein
MKFFLRPVILFLFSLIFSASTKAFGRPRGLGLLAPPLFVASVVIYDEFYMPNQGGGASFWPIALVVACGISFIGAFIGYFVVKRFVEKPTIKK